MTRQIREPLAQRVRLVQRAPLERMAPRQTQVRRAQRVQPAQLDVGDRLESRDSLEMWVRRGHRVFLEQLRTQERQVPQELKVLPEQR